MTILHHSRPKELGQAELMNDRPTTDIAELLGIAESTVRVHLARGNATLAAALEGER